VRRALKHAVEKLQQAGHEIVDWEPELHQEAVDLLVSERLTAVAVCD
jgi:amidase